MPSLKPRIKATDPQKVFHYTDLQRTKPTRENDPYEYQVGLGNRHQSEVIPGALPIAQNNPQDRGFGLYTEGITYSYFAAPRAHNTFCYMYRARPSAAHRGYKPIQTKSHIENCFLSLNKEVETLPEQAEWSPFPLPKEDEKIDFTDGHHTLCGSGDPNLREGIALYVYMINQSMTNKAYCNTDGDYLFTPQLGNLDVVTEMGKIFLQPGEIMVIPRGVRFAINLAPGTTVARGHICEIWGATWELPDLGPLGGHGLANPRDFLFPVAAIDDDLHQDYEIVVKNNGKLVKIEQDHSPFDVVAWHGNCVPYKYDLTKFASQNATTIDHTDPSVNTVLTAKSHDPNVSLVDYLWFGPRWDVATNCFRLPYFHRNSASELLACIYGNGLGRSDDFQPGGCSYEAGHTPHGGFSDGYVEEVKLQENEPRRILENQMTIMVESCRTFLFTEYARKICGVIHTQGTDPKVWDKLPDHFSAHPLTKQLLARIKEEKEAEKKRIDYYHSLDLIAGRPDLQTEAPSAPAAENGHANGNGIVEKLKGLAASNGNGEVAVNGN
ncbi:RmlC-like cupin domain-containing protein [Xylogone sp. PMI_703]|nr:RmlC-like cupin domain-containing protein [Xylogone sp. PMI_703]